MNDSPPIELPELHSGDLDAATLAALIEDLEGHAEVLDVLVKSAPGAHVSPTPVPLREAYLQLISRTVRGVQVRYLWQGAEWRDTLLRVPGAVRVVRMRMP